MPNFCQEYSTLLNQLEILLIRSKDALSRPETKEKVNNIKSRLINIEPTHKRLKELLESTTTLEDGQEIRQIELLGLTQIMQEAKKTFKNLSLGIADNQVESLNMRGCPDLRNVNPIKLFTAITRLHLFNPLVKDVSMIGNLTKLEHLGLDISSVEYLPEIINLVNLETFSCEKSRIKDISRLVELKENGGVLNTVYMSETPAAKDPNQRSNIKKLESLGVNVYH